MYRLLAVAILATLPLSEQVARFDNYKVYRIIPDNEQQTEILAQLGSSDAYSIWSFGRDGRPIDIMVPPHMNGEFTELIESQGMKASVFIENVQERIDTENPLTADRANSRLGWTSYHRLNVIYDWLRSLESEYPEYVQVVKGGETYLGRDILGVHVSFSPSNRNRAVFLEGGMHAREWISPATVTYILNELLTSTDPEVRAIADSHDWYVFPNSNPDGYEYTHTNNRLWRKTRTRYTAMCYGADPNRNWAFEWGNGGVSFSPCSETYAGAGAFSEIETQTFSTYISSIVSHLRAYISIHSYSQLLLLPYGVTGIGKPSNYNQLLTIGRRAATALKRRYGTEYTVGNLAEVLYVASGSSFDWVKGTHNVNLTFAFELRDTGRYGFVLPASQIIPTAEETLDAVLEILKD
ncbi:zinc carboxypeptidase-like [Agrilus planipennis]|uniref:Zinc carboxypeptidase A 1 n=1 Tax=Agrilus planipennis TaxID=224129 RepID=A0A1W4XFF7_AGRPL|nr:zinc carboxypeptidase-like [Agrilus planipennis]